MTDSAGATLARARSARGFTVEQAAQATRIRAPHIVALEEDAAERLPAPVYARGYLRAYAAFLELDPEPLLAGQAPVRSPMLERRRTGIPAVLANLVLTGPVVGVGTVAILLAAFGLYARHELAAVHSLPSPAAVVVASAPRTVAQTVPGVPPAAPRPISHTIHVLVSATQEAWINVSVDGKPVYGDMGIFLAPGTVLRFVGSEVSVTSGKGAQTFVTVDSQAPVPVGDGVATRVFSAQT